MLALRRLVVCPSSPLDFWRLKLLSAVTFGKKPACSMRYWARLSSTFNMATLRSRLLARAMAMTFFKAASEKN